MKKYGESFKPINENSGTSLAVQWLGLHTSNAGGAGSIPGWGTKIRMLRSMAKKKKKERERENSMILKVDFIIIIIVNIEISEYISWSSPEEQN